MGTNGKNKPYSELGKLLDAMARERDGRGPYSEAQRKALLLRSATPGSLRRLEEIRSAEPLGI